MAKLREAQAILKSLGLPPHQQNEMSALTLLALCGIGPKDAWSQARRASLTVTKGIMVFVKQQYGKKYAPNTRETFRRQVLHQFVQARIADYNPDNPDLPTNSPRAHYAISEAALEAVRIYGTNDWEAASARFRAQQGALLEVYRGQRKARLIPVRLPNGTDVQLSVGTHNQVQAAVIHEFVPRFVQGARVLYLGDTAKKILILEQERLQALGLAVTEHEKLPDLMVEDTKRKWLFLVEAVTSHGPMSSKRVFELKQMLAPCPLGLVFVTAFLTMQEFRKHSQDIAWETEVWIAEIPEHLIHYNGDKFLGPR